MNKSTETAFHQLLIDRFLEYKAANIKGEFEITIRAFAYGNSKEIKIESTVNLGSYDNRATMKARTVDIAFPIAMQRAGVNDAHKVPLLTVDLDGHVEREMIDD